MKPCSKNREAIAWLALDALDPAETTALRNHLAACEGCRAYWEEMSKITARLASAAPAANVEASESFNRRVADKLAALESRSRLDDFAAWLRGTILNWRVALPALALLVIALVVLVFPQRNPSLQPPPSTAQAGGPEIDPAPTLANYQMIASQSLEQFSELLTRQGNKSLPPVPADLASLNNANTPF